MNNFHTKSPEPKGDVGQVESVKKIKTAQEARAWFDEQGMSIAEWSRKHGYPPKLTRDILAGKKRCSRGMSHQIAVMLGMKEGQITRSLDEARQQSGKKQGAKA